MPIPRSATIYVRIPVELKEQFTERCATEERTLAVMVTRAIRHFMTCESKPMKDEY